MLTTNLAERVAALARRAGAEEREAHLATLALLQQPGITSVPQLIEAAGDARRTCELRTEVCAFLALLGERTAAPAIAAAFEETADEGLSWAAGKALARFHAREAAPAVIRVLEHGPPVRQVIAAYVLGWLDAPAAAIPPLRAAAMDARRDVEVRAHAAEALGALQAQDATADLIALLQDDSAEVTYWAAYALGQIGDPASLPALERLAAAEDVVLSRGRSLKAEALDAIDTIRPALEPQGDD